MKKYLGILKSCLLFEGMTDAEILAVLECLEARVTFFDKKYTIFAEGSPAKYVGIVLNGVAQVIQIDYYGNRSILSVIKKADVFAEAFACAGIEEIPVTVIANEPCEVMLIDCNRILHTCAKHCAFHQRLIFNLMKDLAQKTLLFHQRIDVTSRRTTREKLMAYLLLEAKRAKSDRFDIPFDRQELADYLEVDRSGLSTELGKLKREGVLTFCKNHFELL